MMRRKRSSFGRSIRHGHTNRYHTNSFNHRKRRRTNSNLIKSKRRFKFKKKKYLSRKSSFFNFIKIRLNVIVSVIMFFILSVFLLKLTPVSSMFNIVIESILFIVTLLLVFWITLLSAKKINSIDLSSDLHCWGLRIFGVFTAFLGIFFLMSSFLTAFLFNSSSIFGYFSLVIGICLLLLSAFMEFRSLRRYPMVGVWKG